MGYALNLCNTHISVVPYNQNIGKEGIHMAQDRVRIADVADSLGLSTATVSKVIHGKTEKISDETVKRVQLLLDACIGFYHPVVVEEIIENAR